MTVDGTLKIFKNIAVLPTFAFDGGHTGGLTEYVYTDSDTGLKLHLFGDFSSGPTNADSFTLTSGDDTILYAQSDFGVDYQDLQTAMSNGGAAALTLLFAGLATLDLSEATEPITIPSLKADIRIVAPPNFGLPGDDALIAIVHTGVTLQFDYASNVTATGPAAGLIFNAAASVTFDLTDANSSQHAVLPGLVLDATVAGASITIDQKCAGPTQWYAVDWVITGQPVDLTFNAYNGDHADQIGIGRTVGAGLRNVVINTYGGNDTIEAPGQHVTVNGGDGVDVLAVDGYQHTGDISFDLLNSPDWTPFGLDSVSNIERVSMTAGSGDDTLIGGDYADLFFASAGTDSVRGGDGSDNLNGGDGNDTLYGEAGADAIHGNADDDLLYGDGGTDEIDGSDGSDTLYGGTEDDYLRGGNGTDSVDGGDGIDTIAFDAGNFAVGAIIRLGNTGIDIDAEIYPDLTPDGLAALIAIAGSATFTLAAGTARGQDGAIDHFVDIESVAGSSLADFLIGDSGTNVLYGASGDDWLYGEGDTDTLFGSDGFDHLFGGSGNDSLYGGSNNDTLEGGAGDDLIEGDDGGSNDGTGDTAVYAGAWIDFTITGTTTLTIASTAEGTDTVRNIDFFTFNGVTVAASEIFNEGPTGVDDTDAVDEASDAATSTAITGNVLGNDTDPNDALGDTKDVTGARAGTEIAGGSLTTVSGETTITGTYGTLKIKADGSYTYTLDSTLPATLALTSGSTAHDIFTYEFADAAGSSDQAQVDITIREINDAPTGADKIITIIEDGDAYTFSASDFGFADTDGDALQSVIITALPPAGTLSLNGVAVTLNQTIAAGAIGTLVFTPAANGNGSPYGNIGFKLVDTGGTANGGHDTDAVANFIRFDVTGVNDAPDGTDKTISIAEDGSHAFAASDFGFVDPDGNGLQSVIITTLPAAGTLTLNGIAVALNQTIAAAAIGTLVFTPAANVSGAAYASFGFKVVDTGGTADSGNDTDATANTIRFDVTAVNDAPLITSNGGNPLAVDVNENTAAVTVIVAGDIDSSVGYSLTGADAALFDISSTGDVTFKAAPDFETPRDAGLDNIYAVTVVASDTSLTDTQDLTITVLNRKGNTLTGSSSANTIDATHKSGGKFATGEEDKIDGKAGNDRLGGAGGNDTLIGGAGKDTLDGGAGADKFVFNAKLSATTNVDTIKSFTHDLDVIQLDDAIFKKIGTSLSAGEFYAKAGAVKAHDANDRIIYDKSTGKLYYDDDGGKTGGHDAVLFATLSNKPASLDHGDFIIV